MYVVEDVQGDVELATLSPLEVAIWRESNAQLVLADGFCTSLDDLKAKPGSILNRAAVSVSPLVAGFREELVD